MLDQLIDAHELTDQSLQGFSLDGWCIRCNMQTCIGQGQLQEILRQGSIILEILLLSTTFYFVKRRLGDIHITTLNQFGHLSVKEGQKQRSYVRTINICVRHDDDAVIAQFVDIELIRSDSTTERSDQRSNLG